MQRVDLRYRGRDCFRNYHPQLSCNTRDAAGTERPCHKEVSTPAAQPPLKAEHDVETRAAPRRGADSEGQACSLCSARTALLGRTRAQRLAVRGH